MLLKNPKKLKIILCLPLALFFIVSLFYFSPPAKAEVNDSMPRLQIPIPELDFTPTKQIMEKCREQNGQKICDFPWIAEYIAGIYKYAIGVVGILAAVVLMIGGVMWIMAGGSATMIGEAKAWIGASLTGLVIALTSYLILYQINPALTVFQPLGIAQVKGLPITETDLCSWQLFKCQIGQKDGDPLSCGEKTAGNYEYCCCAVRVGQQSAACSSRYRNGNIVNFNNITDVVSPQTVAGDNCKKLKSLNLDFDSHGRLNNILRALAVTESSCNPQEESPAGACGLMQLLPETARLYNDNQDDDSLVDCAWLKNNPKKSIAIAFKFISAHANTHENLLARISAGYNSGYATEPNPKTGKKGGLAPSDHCPDNLAFECCIEPGELAQTQDHVFKTWGYYNWIRNNGNDF